MNAEICKQLGISRSVTSAYHPQTNGLDQRTNQTLKVQMAKLVNKHQDDWDEYLEEIAFSIRTQKQASTKYSPFFLMFGRHARSPMEVRKSCWKQALFLYILYIGSFQTRSKPDPNLTHNCIYHSYIPIKNFKGTKNFSKAFRGLHYYWTFHNAMIFFTYTTL